MWPRRRRPKERASVSTIALKFVVIGVPYFGAFILVVALTARYAAPRSMALALLYFAAGLIVGWSTHRLLRQYGESHPGSLIDRHANVMESLPPLFASAGAIIAISFLNRSAHTR